MRQLLFIITLFAVGMHANAQYVYTIKADSVKITNCDSAELILENHTQNVPGFLFNTGNGRTIFKRGLQTLGNGSFVIGADTLKSWIQGGNSFGTTGVLGTLDNNPLDLYSNGSQRVRLTPAGNALFGSTYDNGYNNFQFYGSIFDSLGYFANFTSPFSTGNNSGAIRLRWGTPDGVYIGFFYQGNQNERGFFATPADSRPFVIRDQIGVLFNSPYVTVGEEESFNSKLNIANYTAGVNDMTLAHLNTGGTLTYDMTVAGSGNTILGGTTDNGNLLQVNGNSSTTGTATIAGGLQASGNFITLPAGSGVQLTFAGEAGYVTSYNNSPQQFMPLVLRGSQIGFHTYGNIFNDGDWFVGPSPLGTDGNYVDSGYRLDVNGSTWMQGTVRLSGLTQDSTKTNVLVSDANGNLYYRSAASLAGDNLVRSSLAVNGTIKSKKIIISPDEWADYVFDSSYRLPKLAEVESYIHQEHHLPGIPSAAAIQKDSLDVGAGQAALLKKIEELTLYTIDQQTQLQDQKKEIAALRDEIDQLKELITGKSVKK